MIQRQHRGWVCSLPKGFISRVFSCTKLLVHLGCWVIFGGLCLSLARATDTSNESHVSGLLHDTYENFYRSTDGALHTISGYVTDAETGESLIGASVHAPYLDAGTATNKYGFFSLTIISDSVTLAISHVGYISATLHRDLHGDIHQNIELQAIPLVLDEIEIVAESASPFTDDAQMSQIKLPVVRIRSLPALIGESDILKTLQLLPGVQSGTEATTGLHVRGGGPDQNLFLLDGVTVYNPSHLFGFLGTFNGDAIKDIVVIKGGFPARYGGRLSSVVDLTMKEGNLKKFQGSGTIGLVASSITLEGPIKKDRASFLFAARRSYLDLLIYPFLERDNKAGYYLYDINAKTNYIISERDRVFLSFYTGHDRAYGHSHYEDYAGVPSVDERQDLGWRNLTTTARWNRILNPRLFVNTLVGYTRYRLQSGYQSVTGSGEEAGSDEYFSEYLSGITDVIGRIDFDYAPRPGHYIRFGLAGIGHTYHTGALTERQSRRELAPIDTVYAPDESTHSTELRAYVENEMQFAASLKLNVGLHTSGYLPDGHKYLFLEPRVTISWKPSSSTTLSVSYVQVQQYIHSLTTSSGLSLPTDLWVPATDRVRPQSSSQIAAGFSYKLGKGYYIALEGYYKSMKHLIEYREGAEFFDTLSNSWQDQIESGHGWSYGTELFFQKNSGRVTGWVGYTLASTQRRFAGLNGGRVFPYRFDRRHNASLVLNWRWKDTVDLAGTWVFRTGQAIWLPIEQHYGLIHDTGPNPHRIQHRRDDRILRGYGPRNSSRMEPYHRLDLAVHLHRQRKRTKRTISFGAYNAYNRLNPFAVTSSPTEVDGREFLVFKKITVLPVVPFVTYRLAF